MAGEQRRARQLIGGQGLLGGLLGRFREGREESWSPNWSQLRRTPISFLPSRRATMSFSGEGRLANTFSFQGKRGLFEGYVSVMICG